MHFSTACAAPQNHYNRAMRLFLAVLVYLLIGAVLGWGLMLLMAGKPWLLIAAFLVYVVAFAKIGCISH
jgi:F0F1-type ATP synthase assembly protein I